VGDALDFEEVGRQETVGGAAVSDSVNEIVTWSLVSLCTLVPTVDCVNVDAPVLVSVAVCDVVEV